MKRKDLELSSTSSQPVQLPLTPLVSHSFSHPICSRVTKAVSNIVPNPSSLAGEEILLNLQCNPTGPPFSPDTWSTGPNPLHWRRFWISFSKINTDPLNFIQSMSSHPAEGCSDKYSFPKVWHGERPLQDKPSLAKRAAGGHRALAPTAAKQDTKKHQGGFARAFGLVAVKNAHILWVAFHKY